MTPENVRDGSCAKELPDNSGITPDSALKITTRKRKTGDVRERACACKEFGSNGKRYLSLLQFFTVKKSEANDGDSKPNKSQVQRDMTSIFGKD